MRERFHVKIARRAEIDLEEIWDYIAADSVENATRFIVEQETRMKTLSYSPRRCSLIPENEILGTRYRHLIIRKYRVVFSNLPQHSVRSASYSRSKIVGYLDD